MNKIYKSWMFDAVIYKNALIVKFKSNQTIYIYHELGKKLLEDFAKAESHGKFFIAKIQKTATFEKTDYATLQDAISAID